MVSFNFFMETGIIYCCLWNMKVIKTVKKYEYETKYCRYDRKKRNIIA